MMLVCALLVAAAAICSDERPLALFSLGAGGNRAWLMALAAVTGYHSVLFMLGSIALALHTVAVFAITSTRGITPRPPQAGDLGYALRLASVIALPLFPLIFVESPTLRAVAVMTLALVEVGQSMCCICYLCGLSRTAGFRRLTQGFRVAFWLPVGRVLVVVPIWSGILGGCCDLIGGLLTAILMAILARRLGNVARNNRKRGVPDQFSVPRP